jgi:hypothetical protein
MIKRVGYPTVDEIVDNILKTLSPEFLEKTKEMTADEFCISQHLNLGMTINDKYFFGIKHEKNLFRV